MTQKRGGGKKKHAFSVQEGRGERGHRCKEGKKGENHLHEL